MCEEFKTWWNSSLHAASFKQHLPYPPPASTIAWAYAAWLAGQNASAALGVAEEREACARLVEECMVGSGGVVDRLLTDISELIRERGIGWNA